VESAKFDLANVFSGDPTSLDARWRELFVDRVSARGFQTVSGSLWRRAVGASFSCELEVVEPVMGVFGYGRVSVICSIADETASAAYEVAQFSETGVHTDLRVIPDGYVWLGARRLDGDEALAAWGSALARMLDLVDAIGREKSSVASVVAVQRALHDDLLACLGGCEVPQDRHTR